MSWDTGLSGPAFNIAAANVKSLRVMAGPGTGKTFALMRRIARLLESGVEPSRILAVTFTRTAAADLIRAIRDLNIPGSDKIHARTLHSFCFYLLSKAEVFDYLGRIPRPLITFNKSGTLQFEAAPLLQDLDKNTTYGNKRERTKRIRAFEAAWARLQSDEPGWPQDPIDREFHDALINWLKFHNAMLIGELVPEALKYLRNNPACSELNRYHHIVVDEYQDLNKAEQVLIDILSENSQLTVVGDENQSIYRFRHAHPEGIVSFNHVHPETHDEKLIECRRCPQKVVELANELILHNHPPGTSPPIISVKINPLGEVGIVQWDSLEEEAIGVARFVHYLVGTRGYQPGDILILCPRRLIGYGIRDAIAKFGIPVHRFFHEEALESEKAQLAFSLLTLLAQRKDCVALRFWLGFGSPSWLEGEYRVLREHCEATGTLPMAVLHDLYTGALTLKKTTRLVQRYENLLRELNRLNGIVGRQLVDELFPDEEWARTIREAALLGLEDNTSSSELYERLVAWITQPEMPESSDFVRIMSMHKSKGLTSKVVIVTGCIEGLIPTYEEDLSLTEQEAMIREFRRLFFVAITRCTQVLVLSSVTRLPRGMARQMGARVRRWAGNNAITVSSRFLNELGPNAPRAVRGSNWLKTLS